MSETFCQRLFVKIQVLESKNPNLRLSWSDSVILKHFQSTAFSKNGPIISAESNKEFCLFSPINDQFHEKTTEPKFRVEHVYILMDLFDNFCKELPQKSLIVN